MRIGPAFNYSRTYPRNTIIEDEEEHKYEGRLRPPRRPRSRYLSPNSCVKGKAESPCSAGSTGFQLVTNPQDTVFKGGRGDPKRSDFGR